MSSYIQRYFDEQLEKRHHIADPQQKTAIEALCRLEKTRLRHDRAFWSFFKKRPRPIYLWGPVGRGKTFVMDTFFAASHITRKKRVHFHVFMQEVRAQLHQIKHQENPLSQVADTLYGHLDLLCFDEFHISDIADAKTMGMLFEDFINRKVTIVTTSNYHPTSLYPDGLHRELFLPTIQLIMQEFDVYQIDAQVDYRRLGIDQEPDRERGRYHYPWHEEWLAHTFSLLSHCPPIRDQIMVMQRTLPIQGEHQGILLVEFSRLCVEARAQADYLELCRRYHTILIAEVPALTPEEYSTARRFTWLIDICYDMGTQLYMNASCPPQQLYPKGLFSAEFERTVSRLIERCYGAGQ